MVEHTHFLHINFKIWSRCQIGDHDKIDQMEKLIDSKTKAICESIGNPAANVVDIPKMAKLAHKHI